MQDNEDFFELMIYNNIPGLYYLPNVSENSNLIKKIDKYKWLPISESSNSRLFQHYGYTYDYKTRNINKSENVLPTCLIDLKNLLTGICLNLKLINDKEYFNQCIINNYNPGQGISKHIDLKTFGNVIGCFSIGSGSVINFNYKKQHEIYIEENSLYIMSGDSRNIWTHEMPSRNYDNVNDKKIMRKRRISITFRNVPQ